MGFLVVVVVLLLGVVFREELDFAKVELLCVSSVIIVFFVVFVLGELCSFFGLFECLVF